MALSAIYDLSYEDQPIKTLSWKVKDGSEVDLDDVIIGADSGTGRARPLVAGDAFLGLLVSGAPHGQSLPVTGDSTGTVEVVTTAQALVLRDVDVTGVTAETDLLAAVYASDAKTLTLTSASNTKVGHIVAYRGAGRADVLIYGREKLGA